MEQKPAVVAVVGPTATGKTALGIGLAKRFAGEIVSCDSMQVYKGLPIGTAQPTAEELAQAPTTWWASWGWGSPSACPIM
mgnify:CR=1 FL=1